ncbi:MAG: ATP-binding cassette domain-containing protein [Bdellovibrionota bacterium]
MIVVDHVAKDFGGNTVLRDVSFTLRSGELVGLVGPSGGGKSVLLKLLGNVMPPSAGRISNPGREGSELSVGFLFQEGALFDSMSVIENVSFPLFADERSNGGLSHEELHRKSFEVLSEVGLAKAYLKMPGQLSGGMRRRVALARALVNRPELVLLDDPTGGLDPVAATVIIDLIRSLHAHYQPTIVIVSHDIRRLLPNVERVLALFDGAIACDLAPHDLVQKAPKHVLEFLATRFDFDTFGQSPPVQE